MSDGTFDPAAAGWEILDLPGFVRLIGPVWQRRTDGRVAYGLAVTEKHGNRVGIAHGGVLTTMLDTALGLNAAEEQGGQRQATTTLDTQFLAPVRCGEFMVVETEVLARTKTVLFVHGRLSVGSRLCAVAEGTWKMQKA
jgi:uncharacterized protein (TIGR00369 family)